MLFYFFLFVCLLSCFCYKIVHLDFFLGCVENLAACIFFTSVKNSSSTFLFVFALVSKKSQPRFPARALPSSAETVLSSSMSHLFPARMKQGVPLAHLFAWPWNLMTFLNDSGVSMA